MPQLQSALGLLCSCCPVAIFVSRTICIAPLAISKGNNPQRPTGWALAAFGTFPDLWLFPKLNAAVCSIFVVQSYLAFASGKSNGTTTWKTLWQSFGTRICPWAAMRKSQLFLWCSWTIPFVKDSCFPCCPCGVFLLHCQLQPGCPHLWPTKLLLQHLRPIWSTLAAAFCDKAFWNHSSLG